MSIDLKTELAKNEYVEAINKINEKYELPLTIVEIILNSICSEVSRMKITSINEEKMKLNDEKEGEDK